jgi:NADPH:quinone reductase-like Zn-dependent oxidoreductase
VTIPEELAIKLPDQCKAFTLEGAAGIPEAFYTAFQSLRLIANVKSGETVLIHAGASGVGLAAIQLAKLFGA